VESAVGTEGRPVHYKFPAAVEVATTPSPWPLRRRQRPRRRESKGGAAEERRRGFEVTAARTGTKRLPFFGFSFFSPLFLEAPPSTCTHSRYDPQDFALLHRTICAPKSRAWENADEGLGDSNATSQAWSFNNSWMYLLDLGIRFVSTITGQLNIIKELSYFHTSRISDFLYM
jgi:hypothetical protein